MAEYKENWRYRWISEIHSLYKGLHIVDNIKVTGLGWAGHVIRLEEEMNPTEVLNGNYTTEDK